MQQDLVVLLRGINVGGKNVLPMQALRDLLSELGGTQVSTYIQSGNAVLKLDSSPRQFEQQLSAAISQRFGFEPSVHAMSASEFATIIAANPFIGLADNGKVLHTWFLRCPARDVDEVALTELAAESERFELSSRAFYLYAPNGIGRSKLAASIEKRLGVPCTARNQNTLNQLAQRLRALS